MLTQKSFKNEIYKQTNHLINLSECELMHSEEMQQGDKMLTSYYFLYFNYDSNCIIYYKEITEGVIDRSGDVNEVESLGYEILKFYKFR